MFHFMISIIFFRQLLAVLSDSVFFLFNVLCHAKFTPILFTVCVAIVGAVDLDDPVIFRCFLPMRIL